MSIEVTMKFKKSTKGTHVFEEVEPEAEGDVQYFASIPSLYIRKAAMLQPASKIKVTVKVVT